MLEPFEVMFAFTGAVAFILPSGNVTILKLLRPLVRNPPPKANASTKGAIAWFVPFSDSRESATLEDRGSNSRRIFEKFSSVTRAIRTVRVRFLAIGWKEINDGIDLA